MNQKHVRKPKKQIAQKRNFIKSVLSVLFLCLLMAMTIKVFKPELSALSTFAMQKYDALMQQNKTLIAQNPKRKEPPSFEFYNILSGEQTTANDPIEQHKKKPTIPIETAKPVISKKVNSVYMLQVASFRKSSDAERLKAKLLLQGYDVNVVTFSKQQKRWHRVKVGPYTSLSKAEVAKNRLRKEHLDGFIIKTT